MSNHAKAPWKKVGGSFVTAIYDADGRHIATYHNKMNPDGETQTGDAIKKDIATENLIIAAPALLDCLKRAVEYFEANGGMKAYTFLPMMNTAIAKATAKS